MIASSLDYQAITDAMLLFDGIEWLKWLVGSFFFFLGLFAGWWRWGYRRKIEQAAPAAQAVSKTVTTPVPEEQTPEAIPATDGLEESPFGLIYRSEPDQADDLQRIRGIGKALKAKLQRLGIYRFEQVAQWDDQQTKAVAQKLQLGKQIESADWIQQAISLRDAAESD